MADFSKSRQNMRAVWCASELSVLTIEGSDNTAFNTYTHYTNKYIYKDSL